MKHALIRKIQILCCCSSLVLTAVAGSLGGLIAVGPFISAIAAAWVGFLGPVMLVAFMVWGSAFLTADKESEGDRN